MIDFVLRHIDVILPFFGLPFFGVIFDPFFGKKNKVPPQEVISSESQKALTEGANKQALANLGLNTSDIGNYQQALDLNKSNIGDLGTALQNRTLSILNRQNNPLSDLTGIGDYLYGKIQPTMINPVTDYLTKSQQLRNAVTGINPGVDSTAQRLARAANANQLQLQSWNAVAGQLAPLFNIAGQQRNQNDILAMNAPQNALNFYNQAAGRQLLPMAARNQAINDALRQALESAQAHEANVYGYFQPTNFWDRANQSMQQTLDYASRAYGLASGMGGMGGGGGGAGGLGGMMGGGGGGGGGGKGPSDFEPYRSAMEQTGYNRLYPGGNIGAGGTYNFGQPVSSYDIYGPQNDYGYALPYQ